MKTDEKFLAANAIMIAINAFEGVPSSGAFQADMVELLNKLLSDPKVLARMREMDEAVAVVEVDGAVTNTLH